MAKIVKNVKSAPAFIREYKKQIIMTAITVAVCGVMALVCTFVGGMFDDMAKSADNDRLDIDNKIAEFQNTDERFTGLDERLTERDNVEVRYVGTQVDGALWQADQKAFWNFISPAFNYKSAEEYNATRENYVKQLGDCLFTTQFMAYYDIPQAARNARNNIPVESRPTGDLTEGELDAVNMKFTCKAMSSDLVMMPIGRTSDGDYSYIAMVGMARTGNPTCVGFTFSVSHSVGKDGADVATIRNFCCWPPSGDTRQALTSQNLTSGLAK